MKKTLTTLAICGFICLSLMAEEIQKPFTIQQEGKTFIVKNMPTFTTSEPIANSVLQHRPLPHFLPCQLVRGRFEGNAWRGLRGHGARGGFLASQIILETHRP